MIARVARVVLCLCVAAVVSIATERCVPHESQVVHAGYCIKASMQHLHGWHVFHLSHAPETICIDRDVQGKCIGAAVPNPRNHYGCKTFEPMLGKHHCGNPYLHGHPTRDLDGEARCDCPTP